MNADEFVEVVRKGSDKLRVDEIVLNVGERELHGKGMLLIAGGKMELAMTISSDEEPPELKAGIYTRKDFWKLRGVIEDHLEFKCDSAGPHPFGWKLAGGRKTFSAKLNLHPIELIPDAFESMSSGERAALFHQLPASDAAPEADQSHATTSEPMVPAPAGFVKFEALLADYPLFLPACESGTKTTVTNPFLGETEAANLDTLCGEIEGFDFGLVKDEKTKSLRVVLRSKEGYKSSGEEEDWKRFHGFLQALAFIHGVHAWPFRTEYWRDGRKTLDRVTTVQRLARTPHYPFTERLAANARAGNVQWDFRDVIKKVAAFFQSESELSKEVAQILFLFREAGDEGVHSEVGIIALCALFENLVRLLYRVLDLEEKVGAENPDVKAFKEAKDELEEYIAWWIAENPTNKSGYARLKGIVHGANPLDTQEVFKAVTQRLGLKWENEMESVFRTWKRNRNPLFHEKTRGDTSEDELKQSMIDESRIAGAINVVLMKLFEYSGPIRTSSFEDAYRQI
ncbi:MAG: hypothetical protein NT105_16495 [Verrucomicrobia bacterium]|nr:hypothetical protein [Verrucomicrobiota bacterium]